MSNKSTNTSSNDEFEQLKEEFKDLILPYSIIFGIGLLANSIVIFNGIRRRKTIKHFSNYFVLSMGFADLSVLLFSIPVMFVERLVGFKWLCNFLCSYLITIRETFQGASIFSVTTLAILRVRQVTTDPFRQFSKRACRILVAGIWILSFLVCTVPFYDVYKINDIGMCDPLYGNKLRMKIHLTVLNSILITPMVVTTISYAIVIVKVSNVLEFAPDSERRMRRNRSITTLLTLLIISCWISYIPLAVCLLVDVYSDIQPDNVTMEIVITLFVGGSALNPTLVLLTVPKDYRFNIECKRERRVGVEEPNAMQKEIVKSSFALQDQNVS